MYNYKVNIIGDFSSLSSSLDKQLKKINAQASSNAIVINFSYNTKIDDLQKTLDMIQKANPNIDVGLRIDANKALLELQKQKLEDMQVSLDTTKAIEKIKELSQQWNTLSNQKGGLKGDELEKVSGQMEILSQRIAIIKKGLNSTDIGKSAFSGLEKDLQNAINTASKGIKIDTIDASSIENQKQIIQDITNVLEELQKKKGVEVGVSIGDDAGVKLIDDLQKQIDESGKTVEVTVGIKNNIVDDIKKQLENAAVDVNINPNTNNPAPHNEPQPPTPSGGVSTPEAPVGATEEELHNWLNVFGEYYEENEQMNQIFAKLNDGILSYEEAFAEGKRIEKEINADLYQLRDNLSNIGINFMHKYSTTSFYDDFNKIYNDIESGAITYEDGLKQATELEQQIILNAKQQLEAYDLSKLNDEQKNSLINDFAQGKLRGKNIQGVIDNTVFNSDVSNNKYKTQYNAEENRLISEISKLESALANKNNPYLNIMGTPNGFFDYREIEVDIRNLSTKLDALSRNPDHINADTKVGKNFITESNKFTKLIDFYEKFIGGAGSAKSLTSGNTYGLYDPSKFSSNIDETLAGKISELYGLQKKMLDLRTLGVQGYTAREKAKEVTPAENVVVNTDAPVQINGSEPTTENSNLTPTNTDNNTIISPKPILETQASEISQVNQELEKQTDGYERLLNLLYKIKDVDKDLYKKDDYDWISSYYSSRDEANADVVKRNHDKLNPQLNLILSEDKNAISDMEKRANQLKEELSKVSKISNRVSQNSKVDKNLVETEDLARAYQEIDERLGELNAQYELSNEEIEEYITLQVKAKKIIDKSYSYYGGTLEDVGVDTLAQARIKIKNNFANSLGITDEYEQAKFGGNIVDSWFESKYQLFDGNGKKKSIKNLVTEAFGSLDTSEKQQELSNINTILKYIKDNLNEINNADFLNQIEHLKGFIEEAKSVSLSYEYEQKELEGLLKLQERLNNAKASLKQPSTIQNSQVSTPSVQQEPIPAENVVVETPSSVQIETPSPVQVETPQSLNNLSLDPVLQSKSTDYNYELGDTLQDFIDKNLEQLQSLFDSEGFEGIEREFSNFKLNKSNSGLHEESLEKAGKILYDNISQDIAEGWTRKADSGYKPKFVDELTQNSETRNAALNTMFQNYKDIYKDYTGSFEEWLNTPIQMFRGTRGQEKVSSDIFDAFSFDEDIAKSFAKSVEGEIQSILVRPIDTYGSIYNNKEGEIFVPSAIVNKAKALEQQTEAQQKLNQAEAEEPNRNETPVVVEHAEEQASAIEAQTEAAEAAIPVEEHLAEAEQQVAENASVQTPSQQASTNNPVNPVLPTKTDISDEITQLEPLNEAFDTVLETIIAKNQALITEGEIVAQIIPQEIEQFKQLEEIIGKIEEDLYAKNNAIMAEGEAVSNTLPNEIQSFGNLETKVQAIAIFLNSISSNGIDVSGLQALFDALSKVPDISNISTSLNEIAKSIPKISKRSTEITTIVNSLTGLNQITNVNELISLFNSLQTLAANIKGLKALSALNSLNNLKVDADKIKDIFDAMKGIDLSSLSGLSGLKIFQKDFNIEGINNLVKALDALNSTISNLPDISSNPFVTTLQTVCADANKIAQVAKVINDFGVDPTATNIDKGNDRLDKLLAQKEKNLEKIDQLEMSVNQDASSQAEINRLKVENDELDKKIDKTKTYLEQLGDTNAATKIANVTAADEGVRKANVKDFAYAQIDSLLKQQEKDLLRIDEIKRNPKATQEEQLELKNLQQQSNLIDQLIVKIKQYYEAMNGSDRSLIQKILNTKTATQGKRNAAAIDAQNALIAKRDLKFKPLEDKLNVANNDTNVVESYAKAVKDLNDELINLKKNWTGSDADNLKFKDISDKFSALKSNKSNFKMETSKGHLIDNVNGVDYINQVKTIDEATNAAQEYLKSIGATQIKMDDYDSSAKKVNLTYKDLNGNIRNATVNFDNQANSVRIADNGLNKTQSILDQLKQGVGGIANYFTRYFSGYMLVSKTIQTIREGINVVKEFDSALTTISYTMDVSKEQLTEIGNAAMEMADNLSTSLSNAMEIYQIYANMNTSTSEIETMAEPTAILANLSGVDASTAADEIQGVINQFDLTADDAMHIADVYDYISSQISVDYSKILELL